MEIKQKSRYLQAFLLGVGLSSIFIIIVTIIGDGYFMYSGDFNVQQIPFYQQAHEAIRSGSFLWSWTTDLGANFIGSYSFYLLGSPFFWITLIFPSSFLPYLMGPLLILKFGVSSLTAYALLSRFTRDNRFALLGGLLYAFSGFAVYNIFFNHFNDVIALFPLLLLGLELYMKENKRGLFAVMVFVMSTLNYFFFVGEVVFVIIYFLVRLYSREYTLTIKKFLWLAFEAVIGLAMSMLLLMPSLLVVLSNPRVAEYLFGYRMIIYGNEQKYLAILQSMFFPPDIPYKPSFFPDAGIKWTSLSAYIPMFSMVGVIAYLKNKPSSWISRILKISLVMALVPVLNSLFFALNHSFYARWYYMPLLLMALGTVLFLENLDYEMFKKAFKTTVLFTLFFITIGILPREIDGVLTWFSLPDTPEMFWANVFVAILGLILTFYVVDRIRQGKKFLKITVMLLALVVVTFSLTFLTVGRLAPANQKKFIENSIELDFDAEEFLDGEFSRSDFLDCTDNQPVFMGLPSIHAFHSVVPASIMEFYPEVGVKRDVSSKPTTDLYAIRGLLSAKWLFIEHGSDAEVTYGYGYYKDIGNMAVYMNEYFLPMGFAYDYYVDEQLFYRTMEKDRSRLLIKGLYLSDEDIEKYGDKYISPLSPSVSAQLNEQTYEADIEALRAQSAYEFNYSGSGFEAKIILADPKLVFFSVPFEEGFTATVNGEAAEIIKVDIGFMAVACPAGESEIVFSYMTPGLGTGAIISFISVLMLAAYILIHIIKKKKRI